MVLFCVVDCYVRNPTSVFCFNTSNRVLATIKPFGKQSLQYLRYIHVSREPLLEFVPDISVHVYLLFDSVVQVKPFNVSLIKIWSNEGKNYEDKNTAYKKLK